MQKGSEGQLKQVRTELIETQKELKAAKAEITAQGPSSPRGGRSTDKEKASKVTRLCLLWSQPGDDADAVV